MEQNNKFRKVLSLLRDYLAITAGLLLFVAAWSIFLVPNNLMGGGVSGMSAIIYYATGISMGLSVLVINAVLVAVAFFIIGGGFTTKTIYAILFSSGTFAVLPGLIPQEFITAFAVNNGKMLCTIVGGVMTGCGIGLAFTHGGSTGGTDILAMIINKYKNISPGKLLLMMDVIIIGGSLFIPSYLPDGTREDLATKFAVAVYALVLVAVNSYTVDLYLTGSKQSVQVMIFSKKYEQLADAIAFGLNRGVTLFRSRGWYHKQESEVLMVVARKTDVNLILRCIKGIDPKAFISITSAMGVYGLGFDSIKDRARKFSETEVNNVKSISLNKDSSSQEEKR